LRDSTKLEVVGVDRGTVEGVEGRAVSAAFEAGKVLFLQGGRLA